MSKYLLSAVFFAAVITASVPKYSTTAVVTITGAVIKSSQQEVVEKYKRKDCPVCKGKGWYISGDGIAKIQCQYCEP